MIAENVASASSRPAAGDRRAARRCLRPCRPSTAPDRCSCRGFDLPLGRDHLKLIRHWLIFGHRSFSGLAVQDRSDDATRRVAHGRQPPVSVVRTKPRPSWASSLNRRGCCFAPATRAFPIARKRCCRRAERSTAACFAPPSLPIVASGTSLLGARASCWPGCLRAPPRRSAWSFPCGPPDLAALRRSIVRLPPMR